MDGLASYPRMQYGEYNSETEEDGSWFSLAISGLKFLISNQRNNNINHNLNHSHETAPPTKPTKPTAPTKVHILGPSLFRDKLYDIPEYRSTQSTAHRASGRSRRLTKKALKQLNSAYSNYWNQRSSLHSHSVASDRDGDDVTTVSCAGSLQTFPANDKDNSNPSNVLLTSSQIIHPTRDKPPALRRSHSYPLIHSARNMQRIAQYSQDVIASHSNYSAEGMPSPPAVSTTPELNASMRLLKLKNVEAIKSTESANSWNKVSVTPLGSESDAPDAILFDEKGEIIRDHYGVRVKSRNASLSLEVISTPLPKSRRRSRKKSNTNLSMRSDEEGVFSDWSNVSSNVSNCYCPQQK